LGYALLASGLSYHGNIKALQIKWMILDWDELNSGVAGVSRDSLRAESVFEENPKIQQRILSAISSQ
jgi:hypothetical protein